MTNGRGYFRALALACIGLAIMGLAALCRCTLLSVNVYPAVTSQSTSRPSIGSVLKGLMP